MSFVVFIVALCIVLAIGLWPRYRRQKQYKKPRKKEVDKLEGHRRSNLRRVK